MRERAAKEAAPVSQTLAGTEITPRRQGRPQHDLLLAQEAERAPLGGTVAEQSVDRIGNA